MTDPALTKIAYDGQVLTIAGTALTMVPGYKVSELFQAPAGWQGTAEITIEAVTDRSSHPIIAAVVFTDAESQRVRQNPGAFIQHAESMLYDGEVAITGEGAVKGETRNCVYRTRHGAIASDGTTTASGVIIAMNDTQPAIGVAIDGYHSDRVQQLTNDVASALCP